MKTSRRIVPSIVFGATLGILSGCPKPPPDVPPLPRPGLSSRPQEPVPPPVERPIPPERQGDVPEVPPPVKP